MHLKNRKGESLKFAVLGYEYPNDYRNYWQANSINVELSVEHEKGGWDIRGSALSTFELKDLYLFIRELKRRRLPKRLVCSSGALEFETNGKTLRISFGTMFRPPWAPTDIDNIDEDPYIDFSLKDLITDEIEKNIRMMSEKYSPREILTTKGPN